MTLTFRSGRILLMERKAAKEIARAAWELVSSRRGRATLTFLPLVAIMPLIASCSGQTTNTGRLILPNSGGLVIPNIPTSVRTPAVVPTPEIAVSTVCKDGNPSIIIEGRVAEPGFGQLQVPIIMVRRMGSRQFKVIGLLKSGTSEHIGSIESDGRWTDNPAPFILRPNDRDVFSVWESTVSVIDRGKGMRKDVNLIRRLQEVQVRIPHCS